MELHIATSKEAADYDYATFNGTRTLTLTVGTKSLVIKPGTIIGYRDGRNVVYVVTPDKGLNSEYKISEDDFDRKVAPKCDSATKAQARKAFSGKVEKPAATVAPKPIAKPVTVKNLAPVTTENSKFAKILWRKYALTTKVVPDDTTLPIKLKSRASEIKATAIKEGLDLDSYSSQYNMYIIKENGRNFLLTISNRSSVKLLGKNAHEIVENDSKAPKTAVKSPVKQVAKETKAEIAKRNAETHKVIERAAKKAGEESLRKTKEKVAPPKDLPITEKDIKAMAKKLKLPGGAGAVVNDTSYTWNKKGGFADSVLSPLRDNLKANGFTETDAKTLGLTGTAGSYFTNGKYVVYTAAHLGAVKTDNWYVITLTPIEKKA